ncbi:hypothetical protein NECAME_09450 [Necator americanus]|uniref:Uncharacterized protein n=1 Tax=Necator americanus TaxID=51031 RepID=W2TDY0_NECAM|nr:hypothetical protein NECAME_09450 [Necator americanus]ETN80048.1 hypothetical protein NECAME_09450 [Necator americanus]
MSKARKIMREQQRNQTIKIMREQQRSQTISKELQLSLGLSPPRSAEVIEKDSVNKLTKGNLSVKSLASANGIFDKTQWERTRFAKEAKGLAGKSAEAAEKGCKEKVEVEEPKETKMLGEARQVASVKGEYLNDRPKFIVILLTVEAIWCAAATLVWGAAADNPVMPQILAIFNMLAIFLLVLTCLSAEICEFHIARAILLCANITIMAFDNDFDIGSDGAMIKTVALSMPTVEVRVYEYTIML